MTNTHITLSRAFQQYQKGNKGPHKTNTNFNMYIIVFFGEFLQPNDTKKWVSKSNKRIFDFFFFKSPYLNQKRLEITRFKQCVPIGHQI